ncbi:hypothetical protein [Undibacterium sp. TS12]|uniref:hypothetical protein n=1 Tax=Undibacterium sp. TS12 TaxID=2908202 RepID=UPI001F4CB750|nr:hypothetical protein [Undibacterium sp. TS12]MCH8620763.1 hypothetical protein [Undibacterium sp. TS12]
MSALVIKEWKVSNKAVDDKNNFISITGRQSGLLAWLLSLLGVDPTTKIMVGLDRVEFTSNSLAGTESRMIPLQGICSSYYGYHKPWKQAASFFAIAFFIASGLIRDGGLVTGGLVVLGIGAIISLVYYFLNRTLTLGFVENSGVINGIRFKRSVIENIDVNEEQAKSACVIIQKLIEAKEKRAMPKVSEA